MGKLLTVIGLVVVFGGVVFGVWQQFTLHDFASSRDAFLTGPRLLVHLL